MYKKLSKILPTGISILLFASAFIYFVTNNYDQENKLQLSPEKIHYSDKFEKTVSHEGKDVSESGYIKNIRVNEKTGVSEPKIICSPKDNNILAVTSNNFSGIDNFATLYISLDKGLSWNEKQIPLSPKFESSSYSDPYIEFDADGNIVFIAVQRDLHNRKRDGLCFSISYDNGNSWKTNPDFVDYNAKENIRVDKPKLAAGKNTFYKNSISITWTEYRGLNTLVLFSGSTDGGLTFSTPKTIEHDKAKFGSIVQSHNGELFVVFLKNENEIRIARSFDNGESWKSINSLISIIPSGSFLNGQYLIKNISGKGIRINSEPNIILSRNSDLLITYSSQTGDNDLSDIYFCKYINSTSEFTKPVKVNSDNTNRDQFLPAVTEDSSGKLFIVYQDSREDESNLSTNTYLSYSEDGGITFTDKKLSLKSFDPGNISVNNYIGDRNSCVFSGNELIAIWTDGRNNNFDLYAGIFNFTEFNKH